MWGRKLICRRNWISNNMAVKTINIGMKPEYGDKKKCMEIATEILNSGRISGVTPKQMAAEIYSHHYVYVLIPKLPGILKNNPVSKRMYTSCDNGVDLKDDGDPLWRKIIYYWVYKLL